MLAKPNAESFVETKQKVIEVAHVTRSAADDDHASLIVHIKFGPSVAK